MKRKFRKNCAGCHGTGKLYADPIDIENGLNACHSDWTVCYCAK